MRLKDLEEFKIEKPDPKDTMKVKRLLMPQVAAKDYEELFKYLKDNGATFTKDTVPARTLKATQSEFSDQGVEKQIKKNLKDKVRKSIIVSSDDYVIDGHHRWLVALNTKQDLDIIRVDIPGNELLSLIKEFPKTTYKDVYTEDSKNNYGIPDGATLSQLDNIAKNSKSKEKRQRAHWLRNMRRGANKKK